MKSTKSIFSLFIVILVSVTVISCGDDNYYYSYDYSDAPPFPDTANAVSKTMEDEGLVIYTIEEGSGPYDVTIRDNIYAYYTGFINGTTEDDIFESSYVNGSTSASQLSGIGQYSTSKGAGFVRGVIGMKEGERRLIVIPDSLSPYSVTIYYDVEVASISY